MPLRRFWIMMVLLAAGCGNTAVREQRTYVVNNPESGDLALFRTEIRAEGTFATTDYRAGWVDARAVDEVFRDQTPATVDEHERRVQERLAQARLAQVDQVCDLLEGLGPDTDPARVEAIERALVQALTLERRLRQGAAQASPGAPPERFVMVFSADPEPVWAELSAAIERQRQEGELIDTIARLGDAAGRDARQRAEREAAAVKAWRGIDAAGYRVTRSATAAVVDQAEHGAALASDLDRTGTNLRHYQTALQAYRTVNR